MFTCIPKVIKQVGAYSEWLQAASVADLGRYRPPRRLRVGAGGGTHRRLDHGLLLRVEGRQLGRQGETRALT